MRHKVHQVYVLQAQQDTAASSQQGSSFPASQGPGPTAHSWLTPLSICVLWGIQALRPDTWQSWHNEQERKSGLCSPSLARKDDKRLSRCTLGNRQQKQYVGTISYEGTVQIAQCSSIVIVVYDIYLPPISLWGYS